MKQVIARLYRVGDILDIHPQAAQICDLPPEDRLKWQTVQPPGIAWSFYGRRPEGLVLIACGGLRPIRGEDVKEAWALVGCPSKREWAGLLVMARAALDAAPARRIQATAYTDHPGAEATLRRLGMEKEGVMRAYGADGRDAALYARVRS